MLKCGWGQQVMNGSALLLSISTMQKSDPSYSCSGPNASRRGGVARASNRFSRQSRLGWKFLKFLLKGNLWRRKLLTVLTICSGSRISCFHWLVRVVVCFVQGQAQLLSQGKIYSRVFGQTLFLIVQFIQDLPRRKRKHSFFPIPTVGDLTLSHESPAQECDMVLATTIYSCILDCE